MAEKVFFYDFYSRCHGRRSRSRYRFRLCVCLSCCFSSHSLHWLVARALQYMSNTSIFGLSFFQRLLKWTNAKQQLMVKMQWYYWWHPCVILCTKLIFNFNLFCGLLTLFADSHRTFAPLESCDLHRDASSMFNICYNWNCMTCAEYIDIGALFSVFGWCIWFASGNRIE